MWTKLHTFLLLKDILYRSSLKISELHPRGFIYLPLEKALYFEKNKNPLKNSNSYSIKARLRRGKSREATKTSYPPGILLKRLASSFSNQKPPKWLLIPRKQEARKITFVYAVFLVLAIYTTTGDALTCNQQKDKDKSTFCFFSLNNPKEYTELKKDTKMIPYRNV